MSLAGELLVAAAVLGLGVPFALSVLRFRAAWQAVAAHYPSTDRQSPVKPSDRVPNTYCEVHIGARTAAAPGFTVDGTASGFALTPGRWHGPLPTLWIPWPAVTQCELSTRTVGRLIVHCVRLRLTEDQGWFLVDSPAGERLYRFWRSAGTDGPRRLHQEKSP